MKELTKNLVCVCIRNGAQIWVESERADNLKKTLNNSEKHRFIEFENEFINSADIIGVFSPEVMEEITRRKNGQWKCKYDKWHDKFKKCECAIEKMSGEDLARNSRGF